MLKVITFGNHGNMNALDYNNCGTAFSKEKKQNRQKLIDSESILKDSNPELSSCRDSHIRTKNTYKLTMKQHTTNTRNQHAFHFSIRIMPMKIASSSDM